MSDLYLDENGQRIGTFEGKIFGGRANWHQEDLLNVAALETLLGGGAVYSLPSHSMPKGAVAAATFRGREGFVMKILVAVDSSCSSVIAAREAAARPWPAGTTVHVITVVEPILGLGGELSGGWNTAELEEALAAVQASRPCNARPSI